MQRIRGFTLLELMVAVTVSMILLTVGVPSFLRMISENQRIGYTADLFSSLNFARSEAIARNIEVVLCKSKADVPTQRQCTSDSSWDEGWIVYANLDGSTAGTEPDSGADETILQTYDALSSRFELTSSDLPQRVVYLPSGRARSHGKFKLCPADPDLKGRSIEITSTGRPRTGSTECSGGGNG